MALAVLNLFLFGLLAPVGPGLPAEVSAAKEPGPSPTAKAQVTKAAGIAEAGPRPRSSTCRLYTSAAAADPLCLDRAVRSTRHN